MDTLKCKKVLFRYSLCPLWQWFWGFSLCLCTRNARSCQIIIPERHGKVELYLRVLTVNIFYLYCHQCLDLLQAETDVLSGIYSVYLLTADLLTTFYGQNYIYWVSHSCSVASIVKQQNTRKPFISMNIIWQSLLGNCFAPVWKAANNLESCFESTYPFKLGL